MIYDCFMFYNELDLLEIRLLTLSDYVDKFVIVESPLTMQGHHKPLFFQDNRQRYEQWADRIIHVIHRPPVAASSWVREKHQRNAIMEGITTAAAEDWIIISDADEIPSPESFGQLKQSPCRIKSRLSYYYVNCVCRISWDRIVAVRRHDLTTTPEDLRAKYPGPVIGSGWHFSYIGGPEAIALKLRSFSHTEYSGNRWTDLRRIQKAIDRRSDLFDRGGKFTIQPVDNSYPKPIYEDQNRWSHLICKEKQ